MHRLVDAPLDFGALRAALQLPADFSAASLEQAQHAAATPVLSDLDRTDIDFVTVDPAGSRDLDQALHIAQVAQGYLVSYAIADVASFVAPGSALDEELQQRGQTFYFPDVRVALHPPVLSEGAASLLPDQVRPAVLWQIGLDAAGEVHSIDVRRARVRSRQQLTYAGLQQALDAGTAPAGVALLPAVGQLRLAQARQRHAINLDLPEQEVVADGQGGFTLALRAELPVERYNAEISLLTGMAAATLMLRGGYGILRTVPPADEHTVQALRQLAPSLNVHWPEGADPGDVLADIDRQDPHQVAFIDHATSLLRGAGYTVFDGQAPDQPLHAGLGAPYAHVTAPLRRLVDRYGSEICLAVNAGQPVPEWVRARAPELPKTMSASDHLAHEADRAVVDTVEAWLLADRVGQTFSATVLGVDERGASIALDDPVVRARSHGGAPQTGERITVTLRSADVEHHTVVFDTVG